MPSKQKPHMLSPGGARRSATIVALDELRKRDDLESLRKYLIDENCFPALKDPNTSVITMEELKKLARIWKLNEQRNFWKEHSDRNDMVSALLGHVEQNMNYTTKKIKLDSSMEFLASPPTDLKPSLTGRQAFLAIKLKNYCGKKYFNREATENELILSSRFLDFPTPTSQVSNVIDNWRNEDFHLRDDNDEENTHNNQNNTDNNTANRVNNRRKSKTGGVTGIKNKARIIKHRNLAAHLMNYSAKPDLTKSALTLKAIQTFINVTDSDDYITVSNCMIAISNIASSEHVRSLLFEVNALHKFTNMLQYIRGKAALRAAGLLFYYFSCDKETEDRVYNSCSSFLQANGASKETETRMLALYSLNNLMPCIDRSRVADITMRIIHAQFETCLSVGDKALLSSFLLILQNMCCFSNVHSTLIGLNILELIAQVASYAITEKNSELAVGVLKIMQAFLQAPEQAAHLITLEYVQILMTLLVTDNEVVLIQCVRVATTLTTLLPLRHFIQLSKIVRTMARTVNELSKISMKLSKEFGKFFVNVTLGETATEMEVLVEYDIHTALLKLMNGQDTHTTATTTSSTGNTVKSIVVRCIQNLLSVPTIAIQLTSAFLEPLVKFLCDSSDIGAAMCIYNIACVPQCRNELVESKVHLRLLDALARNKDAAMKSALLQILVQLSSSNVCVQELLQQQLIAKMEAQIRGVNSIDIWNDVSLMLLAVVAFAAKVLNEDEEVNIVRILSVICVHGVPEKILENCSNVLKYVSVRFSPFEYLSPVVRAILDVSVVESEEVTENLSNVLYNMTCSDANIAHMLQDNVYIDLMIHIMRNGNLEVQENIAQCIRNFSAHPRCIEILLQTDILSDLIVIALLRTSSEEIKVVCSEAFYNMLCHAPTRLELLKGDLWWAVMRLCRTDSNQVRHTCARALFDLSTDSNNVAPLRLHHILSFVRDIIGTGGEDFLQVCLRSVHNLVRQYGVADGAAIASNEVVSAVRIGAEMLARMKQQDWVRDVITLLLHCAQPQHLSDAVAHEFVARDIVEVLNQTRSVWGLDRQCRLYVSRLLWELSKSEVFTKGTIVADLDPVMSACYQQEPPFEVCDNLCALFLQHVLREKVPPERFVGLPIWQVLLQEGLSADSTVLGAACSNLSVRATAAPRSRPGADPLADQLAAVTKNLSLTRSGSHSFGAYRERSMANLDAQTIDPHTERVFSTKSAVLSLLAYSIHAVIESAPELVTRAVVQGLLQNDLLDHPISRVNALVVISALSGVSSLTSFLLDCRVFQLLHRYLMNAVGSSRHASAQEFCSSFLRNLSLHSGLVPRYVSSSDGLICELIRELLEVPNPAVHLDLAVFFFNSAGHLVKAEMSLNPKFVLDMISRISNIESEADSEVTGINKFTISMVLNKYSFGGGVEPTYVQYMFSYMQHSSSMHTPAYMETATFQYTLDSSAVSLCEDFYQTKVILPVELRSFPAEANLWAPTVTTEPKRHENIILKFSHATPLVHLRVEQLEGTASTTVVFSKIMKEFDMLKESVGATDNNAITEADEELEEDDESSLGEAGLEPGDSMLEEEGRVEGMEQILEESSASSASSSQRATPQPTERGGGSPVPGALLTPHPPALSSGYSEMAAPHSHRNSRENCLYSNVHETMRGSSEHIAPATDGSHK